MQQHQRAGGHASTAAGNAQHQSKQQQSQQPQQQQQQGHHPPATAAATAGGEGGSWGLEQHYDLLGKIGEGTYGVVYLATAKQDKKQLFAIKKFKTGREGDGLSPTAIREILLLRELRHEHIVKLTAVHVNRSEPSLSLAFDYAEHDLYEIIWHHRDRLAGPIDPYVVKSLMWQLLNGLSYLHQNWVIHRDLKPSNVLVMGEGPEAGKVKVADFGLARFFQAPLHPLSDNGVVVTIWYRPPELLLGGRHYTRAVDVWGAGCIFAELLTLRPLFQGQERKQAGAPFQLDQCDKIFRVLGHPSASTWPLLDALPHWQNNTEDVAIKKPEWSSNRLEQHLTDVLRQLGEAFANAAGSRGGPVGQMPQMHFPTPAGIDLLQRMLEYDPMKRITAEEALHHPWFHEVPLPGPNAFMTGGRRIASYPRRHKQTGVAATGTAPAAMQHQQQQQPPQQQQQQQRLKGSSSGQLQKQPSQNRSSTGSGHHSQQQQQRSGSQHRTSEGGGGGRQQQQQQRQQPRQQQQQQQQRPGDSKKRKAEGQGRRSDGGHKGGSGNRDYRHSGGHR